MPRIRQNADRDAMRDFLAEFRAQCARFGYHTQQDIGLALGFSQKTAGNYLKNPGNITLSTMRVIVKVLKPDPNVILKVLGYSTSDIRKLAKEYIQ